MNKKWKILRRALSYVLAAAAGAGIMYLIHPLHKLDQLSGILEEKYIGGADVTAMEDAAASAMVQSLGDRYSYYIPKEQYDAHVEGQYNVYVGIGVTIRAREDGTGVDIEQVEPGGPAQKAGILPGDLMTAVDGKSLAGMDVTGVKALVQGKEDTDVTVTVLREGEEKTFTLTRKRIQLHVAAGQMLPGNVGYVSVSNFSFGSADDAILEIEKLLDQGAEAFVFDVRNNPGGFASEMNKLLDYLLPEGKLFCAVDYQGKEQIDMSDEKCLEMPMTVLVNGSSYSAAEFFAAALSEYGWAKVVGEPTTGKGRFQSTITLLDGSAINLSIGKYTTPNGVDLTEVGGIRPDVTVEVDEQTAAMIYADLVPPEEDPQVLAALELLTQ